MTLTTDEENILKKTVELQKERAKWSALHEAYQIEVRAATQAKIDTLTTEVAAMDTQYAKVQTKEAEIKAITEK